MDPTGAERRLTDVSPLVITEDDVIGRLMIATGLWRLVETGTGRENTGAILLGRLVPADDAVRR